MTPQPERLAAHVGAPADLVIIMHRVGSPEAIELRKNLVDEFDERLKPKPQTRDERLLAAIETPRRVALPIPKRQKMAINREIDELGAFARLNLKERKKILARKRGK